MQATSLRIIAGLLALMIAGAAARAAPNEPPKLDPGKFKAYVEALWPEAQARGITRKTFDLAFAGVEPDPRVMAMTRRQPEYGKPIGDYIKSFVTDANVSLGLRKAFEWKDTLAAAEKKFGVDRNILIAIWSIETGYGSYKAVFDVIRSLATLDFARYREDFFRDELLTALTILQEGHVKRAEMLGSWAGALGQPQFMPTSFKKYAIDFSGDGRADIWTNVPDVLGSIANYFHEKGWTPGLPWGFEVTVPKGFDYAKSRGTFAEWAALGVKRADGHPFPADAPAILFFPSGAKGPAFLVTTNFVAIKAYNISDAYALAIAHMTDRMRGGGPIRAKWPENDKQLSKDDRVELQQRLAALGYPVTNFRGQIDFDLRDFIRNEQAKAGMLPDGHPTAALMQFLRAPSPQSKVPPGKK